MRILAFFCALLCSGLAAQDAEIRRLYGRLEGADERFGIPALALSYEENFAGIQPVTDLEKQARCFDSLQGAFGALSAKRVSEETLILYKTLAFELPLHAERIRLGLLWKKDQAVAGPGGLYQLADGAEWYAYFVKKFTGLQVSPGEVFQTGLSEVAKARADIAAIRKRLGIEDDQAFIAFLSEDRHYLTDKSSIVDMFHHIDSTVRSNLADLFDVRGLPPIKPMEWQGATASTPPGIYLNKRDNAFGVDVFQYNFHNQRFNRRCMEWLYLHEAIPGHHLQSGFFRSDRNFYFGTSEGWACYVEKLGDRLGLYKDILMKLGEHEWDLVRSARLVMEVGIHYYGWNRERAMKYWKENIPGQMQIADREISRITAWPGQALCYKMGALAIKKVVEKQLEKGASLPAAHRQVLINGNIPLQALL